ncbi:MAG: VWA domain-containing protein, partial [Planctomycetaceae bacterium]|nr:VWA domain-containing protein [Planctomycetaceae bacterium]
MRRLPIYILIDVSESMVGEPIQAVETGLAEMFRTLRKDPYALEMAYLSIITFGTTAKQIVPLTELSQFQMPKLCLGSGTALGAGLELLEKRIDAEVQKTTADLKGDYKPLAFLFTDGEPTDHWQTIADRFMHNRHLQLCAIGCGPDTNYKTLCRITEIVIAGDKADQQTLSAFFKFVSQSVSTASQAVDKNSESKISLDKLPVGSGIKVVDVTTPQPKIEPNRFVFLHCRCTNTKKFYLMKYVKNNNNFKIAGAFPLDEFDQTAGPGVVVAADQLTETAPCPYCGSPRVGKCSCGKMLCLPTAPLSVQHCSVIIAVDCSGSMDGDPMKQAQDAAMKFVSKIDLKRFTIGVMAFADRCKMKVNPTSDFQSIKKSVFSLNCSWNGVGFGNSTHPFTKAKEVFEADEINGKKVLIVLADGVWENQKRAIRRAKELHELGIDVVAIGFGEADKKFLEAIASSTKDAMFTDLSKLGNTFENVAQNLLTAGDSIR